MVEYVSRPETMHPGILPIFVTEWKIIITYFLQLDLNMWA
jgi:hypothetical protein